MRFWDSSAIVPLCVNQPSSEVMRALLREDSGLVVWWASLIQCWFAFARLRREGVVDLQGEEAARTVLEMLRKSWVEILPGEEVRVRAGRLLRTHPLRASDALQLGAALVWAGSPPSSQFVSLDHRLQEAALLEGLSPLPA